MIDIPEWLDRPAHEVAQELLGWQLVRHIEGEEYRGRIVETEAYEGNDPACHGYQRKTNRNQAIFGKAGSVYVYLIYGMYHCVNVVTDREGICSAVLLRALELDKIPPWCTSSQKSHRIAAGPGKLCKALKIDRELDGVLLHPSNQLWLEPPTKPTGPIIQTTRIGITKGVETPWRWYLAGSPAISKVAKAPLQN